MTHCTDILCRDPCSISISTLCSCYAAMKKAHLEREQQVEHKSHCCSHDLTAQFFSYMEKMEWSSCWWWTLKLLHGYKSQIRLEHVKENSELWDLNCGFLNPLLTLACSTNWKQNWSHTVPHWKTGSYGHHLLGHLKIKNSAKINNTETKEPTIHKMLQQAMFLAMWIKKVPDFCKTIISSTNPNILHATSINPTTNCNGGGHEP